MLPCVLSFVQVENLLVRVVQAIVARFKVVLAAELLLPDHLPREGPYLVVVCGGLVCAGLRR